jgi:hypothetical protein
MTNCGGCGTREPCPRVHVLDGDTTTLYCPLCALQFLTTDPEVWLVLASARDHLLDRKDT